MNASAAGGSTYCNGGPWGGCHTDPHMLVILGAVLAFTGVVWLLMRWAERRWNRPGKKRRLPR